MIFAVMEFDTSQSEGGNQIVAAAIGREAMPDRCRLFAQERAWIERLIRPPTCRRCLTPPPTGRKL
jgi:hypothetical protein